MKHNPVVLEEQFRKAVNFIKDDNIRKFTGRYPFMPSHYFTLNHGQHGITASESKKTYLKEGKEKF